MLFPVVHNISISRFISIGLPGWVDWIFFKSFNNECDFHYVFHCNSLAQIWWFIVHLNCNILQIGLLTSWFYSLKRGFYQLVLSFLTRDSFFILVWQTVGFLWGKLASKVIATRAVANVLSIFFFNRKYLDNHVTGCHKSYMKKEEKLGIKLFVLSHLNEPVLGHRY